MIHERHDGAAALEKPVSKIYARNIRKLIVRNIEQPRQLDSVRTRLIEHEQKLAVRQHRSGSMGLQQIVDVLRQPRSAGPIFAHPLPEGKQEIRAVFMLEQQVNFVDIEPCVFAEFSVSDDAVEHAVQHDEHADRQELLAEVADVIAEDSRVCIHIRVLGKRVQTSLREQFQR